MNDAEIGSFKNDAPVVPEKEQMFSTRRTLKGHLAKIYAMQWADDSKNMVSASQDGKLIVWDALENVRSQVIPLKSTWVMTCAYSPSEIQHVACGGLDNICTIYNLRQRETPIRPIRELSSHTGYISCCRFLNEKTVLTSSGDMSCIQWDTEKGVKVADYLGHNGDVMCITINPDKRTFATGSCDATVKVWDIRSASCVQTFAGHDGDINAACYLSNGHGIASGSDDSSCRLFDIRADRELQQYQHASLVTGVTSVCFSLSGRLLFSSYEDFHCIIWDTLSGTKVSSLPHTNRVSTVAVNDNGSALATASWDSFIRVWA